MNINEAEEIEGKEGGQKERQFRGNRPFRQPREPREPRPPRQEADPNSNYKLYYEADQNFYLTILKEEEES
jgi:hypothetical protein